jgi:uncharacterized protein YyaL (SSP411 family)
MPGFPRVLISVAEAYRDRRDDINATSTSNSERTRTRQHRRRFGTGDW